MRIALQILLTSFAVWTVGSSAEAPAQSPGTYEILCRLDPKCPKIKLRQFQQRGVHVEGQAEQPPLSVNLYVNFAYNSADLLQDARITLDQLGDALKNPSLARYSFKIAGHTDAKGTDDFNQKLSDRRADAVRAYIVKNFGISPSRLTTVGYGKSQLLDPAHPEDGVNRRVQIINIGMDGS
jgi:outer membrane protein OmpA-like peptidoglycan-associated protein